VDGDQCCPPSVVITTAPPSITAAPKLASANAIERIGATSVPVTSVGGEVPSVVHACPSGSRHAARPELAAGACGVMSVGAGAMSPSGRRSPTKVSRTRGRRLHPKDPAVRDWRRDDDGAPKTLSGPLDDAVVNLRAQAAIHDEPRVRLPMRDPGPRPATRAMNTRSTMAAAAGRSDAVARRGAPLAVGGIRRVAQLAASTPAQSTNTVDGARIARAFAPCRRNSSSATSQNASLERATAKRSRMVRRNECLTGRADDPPEANSQY